MTRKRAHRITRDSVLFVVGIAGIIHEAVRHGTERPTLLLAFLAMAGLPPFIPKPRDEEVHDEHKTME